MESVSPPAATTAPPPDDVAALLREQLRACHELAKVCFAKAQTEDDLYLGVKYGRLTLGTRLIKTSASLAMTLKRFEDAAKKEG